MPSSAASRRAKTVSGWKTSCGNSAARAVRLVRRRRPADGSAAAARRQIRRRGSPTAAPLRRHDNTADNTTDDATDETTDETTDDDTDTDRRRQGGVGGPTHSSNSSVRSHAWLIEYGTTSNPTMRAPENAVMSSRSRAANRATPREPRANKRHANRARATDDPLSVVHPQTVVSSLATDPSL